MRHVGAALGYLVGAVLWLFALGELRWYCIFDAYVFVEQIGMRSIDETFSRNLLGAIALRVDRGACERDYLYTARRYRDPSKVNQPSEEWEAVDLNSLVDPGTWKMTGFQTITTSYSDARHEYVLWTFEDEIFLVVYDR